VSAGTLTPDAPGAIGCRAREAAVVAIGGHEGPAAALITTACVHEHVKTGIPACKACLDRHAGDPLCCAECEYRLPRGMRHCCRVTITATPIGVAA